MIPRPTTQSYVSAAPGLVSLTRWSRCSTSTAGVGPSFCPTKLRVRVTLAACPSKTCCLRRQTSASTGSAWLQSRRIQRSKIISIRYESELEVGLRRNKVDYSSNKCGTLWTHRVSPCRTHKFYGRVFLRQGSFLRGEFFMWQETFGTPVLRPLCGWGDRQTNERTDRRTVSSHKAALRLDHKRS